MPPKQKQVKKGPVYKSSLPAKDLVSLDVKQPPREPKALKYPQNFPQAIKNQKKSANIFEVWPSQQVIKTQDFGINSQQKFEDAQHQNILKIIKRSDIAVWKTIHEIQQIKKEQLEKNQQLNQGKENQSQKIIQSQKILVIQTYQRDQTPQQTELRLKQQAQKAQKAAKDKKKGKKQEVKQQGPIKVKDVKMSNIDVRSYMTQQGIWIGSQLQTIKLRNIVDVYSKQPVWKKIYPQQNGVPKITKSGKYCVKLYYMGQPIKIQIDDRIPINQSCQQLFPLSEKNNQKWTLIITKALIKYMTLINTQCNIIGSGLIMHALTGMIAQTIQLGSKGWQVYQNLLGDVHYTKKDIFVSCFSTHAQIPPSNYVKNEQEFKELMQLNNSSFQNKNKIILHHEKEQMNMQDSLDFKQGRYVNPQIIQGYSYCISDYFANNEFNMIFSKQKSHAQLKLRQQYNNLSKVNLNNKTRDQKLEHRKKKKQIKQLLLIEQKKRFDLLNQQKANYHFFKLLGNLNIFCQFSQRQILLAKKCKLNNLSQPPNYQIPVNQKDENKSMISFSVIKSNKQQGGQINPDLNDFSSLQDPINPLQRNDQGIWIKQTDLQTCFTNIQIIYNPASFAHKSIEKIISQNDKAFAFDQNKQILVIQKIQLNQQGLQTEYIDLLFGINYQLNQTNQLNKPYCLLQKYDFDQNSVISNLTKLTNKLDANYLNLTNQNTVFKIYTMCKGNYSFWISSNAKFKLMSISDYLQQYQGYKKKSFTIQYPSLEAKMYFPIAKLNVKQNSQEKNTAMLKVISQNKEITKNMAYKLVKNVKQNQKYIQKQNQGVVIKKSQKKYLAYQYTRIQIQNNQTYDFVLECCPNQNIIEGQCELIVLMKNQSLTFQSVEQVQPVKYIEKYIPNKYGIIFKERLFSNTALNRQSFLVKIVEGQEVAGSGGDKKAAKKGGKQQSSVEFIEKPLDVQRKIRVRILKNDQIIYQTKGTNWASIANIRIPNTKQNKQQLFLQASFDLMQWPEARQQNQQTAKLCWVIISFGTDSIALVRDTKQQDKQKQTKKSWEDKQPGRAQRAKKARKKFLIYLKKSNGEQITEEQQQILNAPRLTKKQLLEEQKKNEDKNKKGAKKDDKKAAKQVKKQQIQQKPKQIIFPKSIDNCSSDIKTFLKVLEDFKVKTQQLPQNIQPRIRNPQQLKAIKDSEIMCSQDRVAKILKNVQRRQTIKLKERDKKDQLTLYLQELTRQYKECWTKYITWRNQDLQKDKSKQQKERALNQILQNQKPTCTETDLQKILNEYKQITNYNQYLYDVGIMVKKNIRIGNLSEKIAGHLTNWEIQDMKSIKQLINNDKIQGIQQNILSQMMNMLEQAQKNPAMILQKQNQAKKAKKGGKK